MKIDFRGINQQLLGMAETLVSQWLPGGKKVGAEYNAYNPHRSDKSLHSFSINLHSGQWADFATNDRGGDLIGLYAFVNGLKNGEAARELQEKYCGGCPPQSPAGRRADTASETICLPIPANAPKLPDALKIGNRSLKPSAIYTYLDNNTRPLRHIYRFEANAETGLVKKEFRPLTCWRNRNGKLTWRYKDIPTNRPLYGLERLGMAWLPVLIVSGEKCANAARRALEHSHVVITWSGGDQGAGKTDWEPLKGHELIWWPDNDDSSKRCMQRLRDMLGGRILFISEDDHPKGWDCADAISENIDLAAYIAQHVSDGNVYNNTDAPALNIAAPDDIFPHTNEKGKKLGTIENVEALLEYYHLEIAYNEILKENECSIAGIASTDGDRLNHFVARVKSTCVLNGVAKDDVGDYVNCIAAKNRRNPVITWINSRPWDGVRRVEQLIDCVICGEGKIDPNLKSTLMIKWLTSAYAAANRKDGDDFRTRGVLVFQGPQHTGKTTFFRALCGAGWGGNKVWFGEGSTLNPESKDVILAANKSWICEYAELESLTRFSLPALKAYLTNPVNTIRLPYARSPTTIYSRTVYSGTVNQREFLNDMTGNSRFWVIPAIGFGNIFEIDMQQVWAEIKVYHDDRISNGDTHIWWLTNEEEAMLDASNRNYEAAESVSDLLSERLDWDAPKASWRWVTCTQLLIDCGYREDTTRSAVSTAGKYLHKMGLTSENRGPVGGRVYFAPPKVVLEFGGKNTQINAFDFVND